MTAPRKGSVVVLAGTRKGAFIFRSDARRKSWSVEGPHFAGGTVYRLILDPRNRETLYAATYSTWWKTAGGAPGRAFCTSPALFDVARRV